MTEPLKAVEADAKTPDDGSVVVTLHTDTDDVEITIPPVGRWYADANENLHAGNFNAWADGALSPDDARAWRLARPRNDDIDEFFTSWNEATGESTGKSRASQRSSRSTAKP